MAKGFIHKQVVFNPVDPDQRSMLEHISKRTNFSNYMKRLIQRDMEGGHTAPAPPAAHQEVQDDIDLHGFI